MGRGLIPWRDVSAVNGPKERRGEGDRSRYGFNGLIRRYMLSAWRVSRSTGSRQLQPTQARAKLMGSRTRRRLCNWRYAQSPHQVYAPWGPSLKAVTDTSTTWTGLYTQTWKARINTWKGAEVWILFGTEHQLQMGRFLREMERGPRLDQVQLFSYCGHKTGDSKWPLWILSAFAALEVFQLGLFL